MEQLIKHLILYIYWTENVLQVKSILLSNTHLRSGMEQVLSVSSGNVTRTYGRGSDNKELEGSDPHKLTLGSCILSEGI